MFLASPRKSNQKEGDRNDAALRVPKCFSRQSGRNTNSPLAQTCIPTIPDRRLKHSAAPMTGYFNNRFKNNRNVKGGCACNVKSNFKGGCACNVKSNFKGGCACNVKSNIKSPCPAQSP
ncbi:hypothetical protein HAV38_10625 [Glaciimonas immobilis]|uniref:hypothetical protein n=1 Tax=Glaciimonas immobilis TaxID=728004 RepID=UPI00143CAE41|nr:hypothetical protein [Glaciimonas immobilis]KAF3998008.1 hypothetical protein HAV38_10625 [Glaciimonas immobilis]